ncbi:sialoadhesin-like [Stegastes partitus]|uniref:Sialoadhesin-like n=2 Tax=Stegastes partitus TaxID=144197 RepID=A0A9Y4TXL5_9TELE|nr:PREDICTED: sialoadhesin-like [Stegastes partitus]
MCSYHHTNVTEACSTTYPKELEVQRSPGSPVGLKCATSCPEIDLKTSYSWYENRVLHRRSDKQQYSASRSSDKSVYCAVKGLEDLLSPEVCAVEKKCWTVNYASRRICALEGSSVNITGQYSHPGHRQTPSTSWYKIKRGGEQEEAEQLNEAPERVEHHDDGNQRILRIKHLRREDSAAYVFAALQTRDRGRKLLDFPRVTLVVTGLSVWVRPAEVTEGQRVTLTCSTSCPLSGNTTYTWKLNSEPLTLPLSQNKHLVLDPVSIQHAGSYSCAVRIGETTMASSEKIVTVQRVTETFAAAAGVGAAFLIITPLVVFFWIRRKRTSGHSLTTEATDNTEQLNQGPLYGNLSAQPTEQDDLHYSSVHFSKSQTAPLYATVEPHQPKEDQQVTYAAVSFRPNVTPE